MLDNLKNIFKIDRHIKIREITPQKIEPQKVEVEKIEIPKGWYVYEAGQNPLHMLWFVVLLNFDDVSNKVENPRSHFVEEYDSFDEALLAVISEIEVNE